MASGRFQVPEAPHSHRGRGVRPNPRVFRKPQPPAPNTPRAKHGPIDRSSDPTRLSIAARRDPARHRNAAWQPRSRADQRKVPQSQPIQRQDQEHHRRRAGRDGGPPGERVCPRRILTRMRSWCRRGRHRRGRPGRPRRRLFGGGECAVCLPARAASRRRGRALVLLRRRRRDAADGCYG